MHLRTLFVIVVGLLLLLARPSFADEPTFAKTRKAAEQGYAKAQGQLCAMYYYGRGVTQNYVDAYMWCFLAAVQDNEMAKHSLNILKRDLTHDQIVEAQKRAAAWRPDGVGHKPPSP
jgi:TPR repeat protein